MVNNTEKETEKRRINIKSNKNDIPLQSSSHFFTSPNPNSISPNPSSTHTDPNTDTNGDIYIKIDTIKHTITSKTSYKKLLKIISMIEYESSSLMNHFSILHLIVMFEEIELLEMVINKYGNENIDMNKKDSIMGKTILHIAIEKRNKKMIKCLIENNCDMFISDNWGVKAIDYGNSNGMRKYLINQYYEQIKKRMNENFIFFEEHELYDLDIQFFNKKIRLFKSLIGKDSGIMNLEMKKSLLAKCGGNKEVQISINEEIVLMVLFGNDFIFDEETTTTTRIVGDDEIIDLYWVFKELKMKSYIYTLTKKLNKRYSIIHRQMERVEKLLEMFDKCVRCFQEKVSNGINFNSIITLTIYNLINEEISDDKIDSSDSEGITPPLRLVSPSIATTMNLEFIRKRYDSEKKGDNYYNFFISFIEKSTCVENHPDVKKSKKNKNEIMYVGEFEKLYKRNLNFLYNNGMKYHNLVMKSQSKEKKAVVSQNINLEIFSMKSNFLFSMLNFSGIEHDDFSNSKMINIQILDSKQLFYLIQFIYSGNIDTEDFHIMFGLLQHSIMFFEKDLKSFLTKKIELILLYNSKKGKGNDENYVNEIKQHLSNLPEYIANDFMKKI